MHEPDRHRALADSRSNPLDRARVDVADGEDPGAARLEEEGPVRSEAVEAPLLDVAAGEHEAVLVHPDEAAQPVRVRRCADEDEERLRGNLRLLARAWVFEHESLEPVLALEAGDLRVGAHGYLRAAVDLVDEVARHRLGEIAAADE